MPSNCTVCATGRALISRAKRQKQHILGAGLQGRSGEETGADHLQAIAARFVRSERQGRGLQPLLNHQVTLVHFKSTSVYDKHWRAPEGEDPSRVARSTFDSHHASDVQF